MSKEADQILELYNKQVLSVKLLNKIKDHIVAEVNSYTELQSEISNGQKAEDICDQPEVFFGRNEYAESLLKKINEWEKS